MCPEWYAVRRGYHTKAPFSTLCELIRRSIQVERRAEQRNVTERLGRVSKLFATPRNFLREHAQVVRKPEHVLKQTDGTSLVLWLVDAGAGHGLYEPERTHAEGTFAPAHACHS